MTDDQQDALRVVSKWLNEETQWVPRNAIAALCAVLYERPLGDTCGRMCEATAYRIENRRLLARNEMLEQGAQRYAFVRTLPPFRFAELFQENLRGKLSFDHIIDREMQAAASLRASYKEMHNA